MNSEQDVLHQLIEDLENDRLTLPTLPEVALQIRDEINTDSIDATRVANTVTRDASLSVKLLQIANSPLYRGNQTIDNIKSAIARLGFSQIRNLVSSLVMKQMFQTIDKVLDQKFHDCWNHSVEVAALACVLARHFDQIDPDQAMLAGLVHDIGKLPLLTQINKYSKSSFDEVSLDKLIANLHPKVGGKILEKWEFPDYIIDCATKHEDANHTYDNNKTQLDYVDIIVIANALANNKLTFEEWSEFPIVQQLGLSEESIMQLQTDLAESKQIQTILTSN